MSNNFGSMTALLGMLAMAGYQNRDKIGELLQGAMGGAAPAAPSAPVQADTSGGLGGLGSLLGGAGGGGLLGSVLSSLTGGGQQQGGQQQGGLGGLLGGLMGGAGAQADPSSVLNGGLGQLVQELQKNGLGDQAASWVSTGPNQEVTPHQLGQAIDPQVLAGITQATGLDVNDILGRLAQVLPQAVDSMTPNGRLPHA